MDISTFHSISEHVVWSERDMSAINLVFSGLASHLGTMGVILSFRVVYLHIMVPKSELSFTWCSNKDIIICS